MKIERFEDIESWKLAQELGFKIYKTLDEVKDYGYRDQICRAVVSISNNIAEWFERQSNNELRKFLYIAKWSVAEVRSMLYLWSKLGYFGPEDFETYYALTVSISKFISSIRQNQ